MHRLQRLILTSTAAISALTLVACNQPHRLTGVEHHVPRRVHHLSDGSYAMRGDDGTWLLYYMMESNNSTIYTSSTRVTTLSGGTWVRSQYSGDHPPLNDEETLIVTEDVAPGQAVVRQDPAEAENLPAETETAVELPEGMPAAANDNAPAEGSSGSESGTSSNSDSGSSGGGDSGGDSGGGGGD